MLQWKDVKGYKNLYQISNYGVVRSLPRKAKNRWTEYTRPRKNLGRIIDKHGFYRISLRKDGKNRKFYVGRLVAIHFVENPDGRKQIRYKDGVKTNNVYKNLEWK